MNGGGEWRWGERRRLMAVARNQTGEHDEYHVRFLQCVLGVLARALAEDPCQCSDALCRGTACDLIVKALPTWTVIASPFGNVEDDGIHGSYQLIRKVPPNMAISDHVIRRHAQLLSEVVHTQSFRPCEFYVIPLAHLRKQHRKPGQWNNPNGPVPLSPHSRLPSTAPPFVPRRSPAVHPRRSIPAVHPAVCPPPFANPSRSSFAPARGTHTTNCPARADGA